MRLSRWLLLAPVALVVSSGCHKCGYRSSYQPCPPATISRSLGYGAVPAGAPCQSVPVMPPRVGVGPPPSFTTPMPPAQGMYGPPPGATLGPPPGAVPAGPPSAGIPQPPPGWQQSQFPPSAPPAGFGSSAAVPPSSPPPSSPPPAVWVPANPQTPQPPAFSTPPPPPALNAPPPPPPANRFPAPPSAGLDAGTPAPPPASTTPETQGPSGLPPDSVQNAYSSPPAPGVRLSPPESINKDNRSNFDRPAEPPSSPSRDQTAEPPPAGRDTPPAASPSPAMPAGIPGFAALTNNVSVGRRPFLDGLDWLKERGYRTVVYLRRSGDAPDDADRTEFESRRGIKYVALDVNPRDLTPDLVKRFTDLVNDPAGQPLFLYDRDGSLTGGLAYLYFRKAGQPDAEALRRAAAAGLRQEDNGPHREMLLAVQKFLGDSTR